MSPVVLSKAIKLKEVVFRCGLGGEWATTRLETITSRHQDLQHITIHVLRVRKYAQEGDFVIDWIERAYPVTRWSDLDRPLVQFWDSRSIRPKVLLPPTRKEVGMKDWGEHSFPELTRRGVVDLVEYSS